VDDRFEEPAERTGQRMATNLHAAVDCKTCGGARMVVHSERLNSTTTWMKEHGISVPKGSYTEEYAPCPDCNPGANTKRVGFASPSNDRIRERLARR